MVGIPSMKILCDFPLRKKQFLFLSFVSFGVENKIREVSGQWPCVK